MENTNINYYDEVQYCYNTHNIKLLNELDSHLPKDKLIYKEEEVSIFIDICDAYKKWIVNQFFNDEYNFDTKYSELYSKKSQKKWKEKHIDRWDRNILFLGISLYTFIEKAVNAQYINGQALLSLDDIEYYGDTKIYHLTNYGEVSLKIMLATENIITDISDSVSVWDKEILIDYIENNRYIS